MDDPTQQFFPRHGPDKAAILKLYAQLIGILQNIRGYNFNGQRHSGTDKIRVILPGKLKSPARFVYRR